MTYILYWPDLKANDRSPCGFAFSMASADMTAA